MIENQYGLGTRAIHAGHSPDKDTHSRAVPIYQTTSFTFDDTSHAADLFGLRQFGNIYSRIMNPTVDALEQRIASLEGGVGALALASGQAAETLALLTLAGGGDEIVSSTDLYGGTVSLFSHTFKKLGITVKFVPPDDPAAWEEAVSDKTKAFFTETIGNPKLNIVDIAAIAEVGRRHGIPLVVDNTVTTPYLLRPFEFGAAIVIHSATKFIGGHGTSIGGLIVGLIGFVGIIVFAVIFRKLFGGGKADISLEDPDAPLESGIEIKARPPGKQLRSISLLSGGERTMTAVALLFAIFRAHPAPCAFLDEVDAAVDKLKTRFTDAWKRGKAD